MAKVLDCDIVKSKFKLKAHYNIHFRAYHIYQPLRSIFLSGV